MAGTRADVVLRVRALAALVAVLLTTAGLLALVAPFLTPLLGGGHVASAAAPATDLDELLVLVCTLLLLVGWARLALGTSVCLVAHLVRRPGPAAGRLRPTTARRLAALLVGSSLGGLAAAPAFALSLPAPDVPGGSASSTSPASAAPATVALPLPGRPVGGRVASTQPPTSCRPTPTRSADRQVLVVRAGDSLWSLAAAHLLPHGRGASERAVDAAWRALYAANRSVIGPDPHLIRPGARLDLPAPAPTEGLP